MRIRDALKFASEKGKSKKEVKEKIADRLWFGSKRRTKEVNLSSLVSGHTYKYDEVVMAICEETGVSPNFLFGYSEASKAFYKGE